jgi:electron transfer flavoprotein beta subunit
VKIVVTVKVVPDTNADKRIDAATNRLLRTGIDNVLNPFDEYAIEAALQLRDSRADGSTVSIFSMAPETEREVVRKALAMGADDAVMLSDPGLAGSDLWATAYAMAHAIRLGGFDLILTGTQSTDAISGDLPGMLAEYLGVPALTYARSVEIDDGRLRVKRETETGFQVLSAPLPALASVTKSANQPRYPSLKGIMAAKKKGIALLPLADLGLTKAVGNDGSRTEVLALATPPLREPGRVVNVADAAEGARVVTEFLKGRQLL